MQRAISFVPLAAAWAALASVWSCSTSSAPSAPPQDAGAARETSADGGASPCEKAHSFCDDFDHGALGAAWDGMNTSGGPLALDDASFRSAPFALHARSPASAAPRSVVLYKNLPEPPGKLRCELDVLVRERAGGPADLFELRLNAGDAGALYYAYLQITETATFVGQEVYETDGGKTPILTPVGNLATGEWRHLRFETDYASFTVSYEGEPGHTETLRVPSGSKPQMALGLVFTEGGGPYDFLFDNVVCDRE